MHKKTSVPLAPWHRHHYLSKAGGGGGLGGVAYKDRARPPHLCVQPCGNTSMVKMASEYACRKGYTLRACLPAGPRPPWRSLPRTCTSGQHSGVLDKLNTFQFQLLFRCSPGETRSAHVFQLLGGTPNN